MKNVTTSPGMQALPAIKRRTSIRLLQYTNWNMVQRMLQEILSLPQGRLLQQSISQSGPIGLETDIKLLNK